MFKLNTKGFSHHFVAMLFVVIFVVVGVAYLVASRAATVPYTSTDEFSKFQYGVSSGTTAPLTHWQKNPSTGKDELKLQFDAGLTGYHPTDVAWYQFTLPANTTATSLNANVSYVNNGYNTVFVATGSPSNMVWKSNTASSQTNYTLPTLNFSDKPTVIYFGITAKGSRGGFYRTFPVARSFTVNSYTLQGVAPAPAPTPTPSPTPSPTPGGGGTTTPNCTKTIDPSTSLQTTLNNASAGDVICLNPGTYSAPSISKGGAAGNPITLTSANPANPALIAGRTTLTSNASYININHLKFKWTVQNLEDAVVLGTPHVNFVHNDVDGIDQSICLNGVSYNGSTIHDSLIDHNTIHNCKASSGHIDNEAQGIYMYGGPGNVISNNWCWAVAARCYQIRGEQGGSWHNNVADDAGQGWIFGDLNSSNNDVYNNIVGTVVGNSKNPPYSAFIYNTGTGNKFRDNCVSIAPSLSGSVASSNNTVVKVQFVDAANHNYNLSSASVNDPCRGYAVQGGNPGP